MVVLDETTFKCDKMEKGCLFNGRYTTIRISKEVKSVLDGIGRKGESYDKILVRVLEDSGYCVQPETSSNDDFNDTSVPYRVVTKEMKL